MGAHSCGASQTSVSFYSLSHSRSVAAQDASPNAYAWKVYTGLIVYQLALAWVVPGFMQEGLPVPSLGYKTLMYKCNAIGCIYITMITAAGLHYYNIFRMTEIIDNFGHLMTVAMIVGSAPVASTTVIRLIWRRVPSDPARHKTLTQRMWPSREARGHVQKKDSRGVPDPFPITDPTLMGTSAEVLCSGTTAGRDNDELWEMAKTGSNMKPVTSHESTVAHAV